MAKKDHIKQPLDTMLKTWQLLPVCCGFFQTDIILRGERSRETADVPNKPRRGVWLGQQLLWGREGLGAAGHRVGTRP